MLDERFLITGSSGCIGAWTVARLVTDGVDVVGFDLSDDRTRLGLILDDEFIAGVRTIQGDIRDRDAFVEMVRQERFTHIVHLAGLQVPFCAADPTLGSEVNVTGTINVLEAVRHSDGAVRGLSYASSIAVFGAGDMYHDGIAFDDSPTAPATLYGAYKQANEATARVYGRDWGVGSVGLRPAVVYGPARDQGLTSDVTKAMIAAASGQGFHIGFGGSSTFQHADDIASTFIAASRLESKDALVHNVPGPTAMVADIAAMIESESGVEITVGDKPLPLPSGVDGSPLSRLLGELATQRSIEDGVAGCLEDFRRLITNGRLAAVG